MLRIRLSRVGRKSLPFYRIVVIDSRKKRNGKYVDILGTYDPIKKAVSINTDLYFKHISCGAQPSEIVLSLFKNYYKNNKDKVSISESKVQ